MTNSVCSSGAKNAGQNNLKDDAYEAFSKYLADVVEHFKTNWGISFQSISPMNEPYTKYCGAFSNKQEGCHFDQGNSQSKIIIALNNALLNRRLRDIQISATDETSIDTQITYFNKLSNEAKKIITRIDTHTYGGSNRKDIREFDQKNGKNLWMSEVDGGNAEDINAGEMGAGLWLANRIILDLNGLRSSSCILWQLIDNHISKDGYNGKKDSEMVNLNGGYWGVAVADHDKQEIILTQKYYVFGQFSRYIRVVIQLFLEQVILLLLWIEMEKKLVIVVTNTAGIEKSVDFDLSSFSAVGKNVSVIRTSGSVSNGEKWAQLSPISTNGKGFNAKLKANSVATFIIEGVEE